MKFDELSNKVIGCALEVHKTLGPGLLESTYQKCFSSELSQANIGHQVQKSMPVCYKGILIDCGYRIDILVENRLIVELKAIDKILPVHEAQILTYLKLARFKTGLLINFNVARLKDGIKRYVL